MSFEITSTSALKTILAEEFGVVDLTGEELKEIETLLGSYGEAVYQHYLEKEQTPDENTKLKVYNNHALQEDWGYE